MRSITVLLCFLIIGLICFLGGVVSSQTGGSATPANCRKKDEVMYRSSGSFASDDTSKVKCTVDYWICNRPYSKSQVVENVAGACDNFTRSVKASSPTEVCCDCYPNCGNDQGAPAQNQNCCNEVEQLKAQLKQLADRVKQLEDKLNGDEITLGSGDAYVKITNQEKNKSVSIGVGHSRITVSDVAGEKGVTVVSDGNIQIKADGTVNIKGSKVTQN